MEYIPKKKKKPLKVQAVADQTPAIPQDLKDKMGAVEATATAFNLLEKGHFPHSYASAIRSSLHFLQKLHEQCVEDALKHPDADLVPELKTAREKGVQNGKTKAAN